MRRSQLLIHSKLDLLAGEDLLSLLGVVMRLVDDHYAMPGQPQARKQGSAWEVFGVQAEARRHPQCRGRLEQGIFLGVYLCDVVI